jgi:Flp pilus assembly protein TadD
MTSRRKRVVLAALLMSLALPAMAGGGEDPLADAKTAITRGDGVSAEVPAERAYALQRSSLRATSVLAAAFAAAGKRPNAAQVMLAKARSLASEPAPALC